MEVHSNMLNVLLPFFNRTPRSSPIRTYRWNSYLENVHRNVDNLIDRNNRYTEDPIPSNGIDFINSLITRADIHYLLNITNDIDLLRSIYKEYQSPVYSDMIRQHPLKEKFFISTTMSKSPEYVLITEDFDIEEELPLGEEDISLWLEKVKPLRMLDTDSLEMRLNITTSRLNYRYLPPARSIFSINIIKLLMLYIKYRQANPDEYKDGIHNYPFIYKSCILPLLHDNIRTYAFQIIQDIVIGKMHNHEYRFNEDNIIHGSFSNFIISNRTPAIREIEDLIGDCVTHSIKPDEIMLALKVSPEMNLLDYVSWIMDSHYMSYGQHQFEWLIWLRDQALLTSIILLYSTDKESNRTKEFFRLFNIMSNRLVRTRFWSHAKPRFLADKIQEDFTSLLELTNR